MAERRISDLLAEIVKLNARNGPQPSFNQVHGLSQAILSSVGPQDPYLSQPVNQPDPRGPSFVNRILDIMSRPLYSVLNPLKEHIEENKDKDLPTQLLQSARLASPITNLGSMWEGLSGKEKTTGRDILEVTGFNEGLDDQPGGGTAKFLAGLGVDIIADPLTYVGIGLIPKIGKAARESTEALGKVETGTGQAAQSISEEISRRAAQQAQEFNVETLVPGLKAPIPGAPPRTFAGEAAPQRLALPAGMPENYPALDANAISQIKMSISKGVPLEQAGLRPLHNLETPVLQEGISAGKSSRQIEEDLVKATGRQPERPFQTELPPVARELDEDSLRKIEDLEVRSAPIYERLDELDQLPSNTTLNKEIDRLEAELRSINNEIMQLQRPKSPTIASPTPKPLEPIDNLKEALTRSTVGKSELKHLDSQLPTGVDGITAIKLLNERIASTKSPVVKNLLQQQVAKFQANVRPADLLGEVRVKPPEFPNISINERWQTEAVKVADNFLRANRTKNINHVGQTNLYNRVVRASRKIRADRRQFHIYQMLRIAENRILASGRHLVDAEGISVRLSDLANISGGHKALTSKLLDDFRKARPSQQLEDLKAYTTPTVASEILDPVIKTGEKIAAATINLPPSQTVMIGSKLSKELAKIAENAGASSKEAATAKAFIDDLFNPSRDVLYSAIQNEARNLIRQSSEGIVDAKALHRISEKTYEVLGSNPKVLGRQVTQGKVVEGIMTKFATWWGAKDLRPFAREYIDTARNVAAAFAETITPLVRTTKPSQRTNAWRVAQGKVAASSFEEKELADQFKYLIERLMGTHGIKENAEAVVLRSGTLMKELNTELPEALRFIDKSGVDQLGRSFDYTKGNWMHSWKEWDGLEPAESLYQLTRALQLVTRKNAMWDDAAVRWGMPQKGAEFQFTARGIDRLEGTWFPKQIAEQLRNLKSQLDRDIFKTPHKSIELFDKIQRMWKTGVTVYSPSHHIRNLNGDVYLSALDGVTSPGPYLKATKILHTFPTRYTDLESVFKIMDLNLRDAALKARPGNIVVTTRRGEKLTAEQVYQAAESQGLFIRMMHIEDIVGDTSPAFGSLGNKFQPFGGKVFQAAGRVTELRDHWVRLAHFIDVLQKSKAPLKTAIEQAGRRVKKFHPDGTDLTGLEQNLLRRVIPFYSWMRKATPLVIEGAIMRPHITLAFPKTMANMQLITGIESEGPGDPFPMDQMFPEWLKEKGIGPLLHPGNELGRHNSWRGEAPGYTVVNPTNPFIDQIMQVGHPAQTGLSSLSPFARVPIELLTKQTSLGIPLENIEGGVPGHLAQQIPSVGIGARITGMTRPNEPYHPEQLINWLTSIGVTGTGPYTSQSRSELRNHLNRLAAENRGNYR